jgi:hypothetical protein
MQRSDSLEKGHTFDIDGEYGAKFAKLIRLIVPGYEGLFEVEESLLHARLGERGKLLVAGAGGGASGGNCCGRLKSGRDRKGIASSRSSSRRTTRRPGGCTVGSVMRSTGS